MARFFSVTLLALCLAVTPGPGVAQQQSIFGTLQMVSRPAVYISDALAAVDESQSGFFAVSISSSAITVGNRTYRMEASSGSVRSGSVVTLGNNGTFLSCCRSGKLTSSEMVGDNEWFKVVYFTSDQVRSTLARRAANQDRRSQPKFEDDIN